MINIINKFFPQSKNFDSISLAFKRLRENTDVEKIFKAIGNFSDTSEIRYVGGCVRKIIKNELVDDIDLAVNLKPQEVCEALKKNNISFYESGIEHGTITATINGNKFEITSLRKDVKTDGRHATVEFSNDWYIDASRRDFSVNAIYADINGNLYDPFNGRKNIESGTVKFIGDGEKRIREDYLRVLRYVRFFLNYSQVGHDRNITKIIKKNLNGISKISSERLLDEFKKLVKSNGFLKLNKDKFCLELINLIFPQFKNIHILKNITKKNISNLDFIILISLLVNDSSDNAEYFLYKFNFSKKNQKRILFLREFFSKPTNGKTFSKNNLWRIFYLNEKQSLLDLLNYQILKSKKSNFFFLELIDFFKDKEKPLLPIKGDYLINKFNISEGKELGAKLKKIEEKWINNNFKISDEEIKKLILN
tara:strand:- start:417 stop:1682 length:1266 start_codon:yes stop_codon:yes gene_type:complete